MSAAEKNIALIYVTSNQQVDEDVQILLEMLEAYSQVDVFPVEKIQVNTLEGYAGIVVSSSYETQIPEAALQALNGFQGPAIAIGKNALQLASFATWQGGEEVELRKIGEHTLESPLRWEVIAPSGNVEVIQKATSFTSEYPFIIKERNANWSYIGMLIHATPFQYEWSAVMGDLLQLPHPTTHEAFMVLTDINMKTNVAQLKEVVERFRQYGIPVSIEVTPIYEDDKEGVIYFLQDNKALLIYLQQLQQEGVAVIVSSSATNLENSLDYLVLREIYPTLATEENVLFSGIVRQQTNHIYATERENQMVYPYTVANIRHNDVYPLYQVEQSMNGLYKAPGSVIGIQYPAYLGDFYVQELVELLKGRGAVEWLDFRKTNQHVQTAKVSIVQTADGEQEVQLSFTYLDRLKKMFDEQPFELVLWLLVITVSIFVTVFFMNTLRLRVTLRKRLFEERKHNG